MLRSVTPDWAAMRGLMIDLDGVVYMGREPIAGAAGFLGEARRRGLPFLLVTNNSTTSPELVAQRLSGMHIDVEPHEILTSAQAAVAYVRAHSEGKTRVRVIGEAGLRQAAEAEGLEVFEDGEAHVDWVVAGLDRAFDYHKLTAATRDILGGARFVATNADALLPVEGGNVLPGAGSIVGAIQIATAVEPIVVGKPEPGLFEHGLRRLALTPGLHLSQRERELQPGEVAMIGDRLDTDVVGARRAGLRSVLVLSGVTTAQHVAESTIEADVVVADLAGVSRLLGWS
jgi:4-nitrophenyl phosphatase